MKREYHSWWSPRLRRDMELLVFGHSGTKVLVFPTRGGRFYEYEDLGITEALRNRVEAGELQLYCVDGIDSESFYCFWAHPSGRVQRYLEYEEYILNEVLPLMELKNPCGKSALHGCSLGAYFAINIGFKYPHLFQKICAFSGRYDLTKAVEGFNDLLGGYYDQMVYYNTPEHFMRNMECGDLLSEMRSMEIVLVCGKQDPFLASNYHLSEALSTKSIPHRLFEWEDRAHRGRYWRMMAAEYL